MADNFFTGYRKSLLQTIRSAGCNQIVFSSTGRRSTSADSNALTSSEIMLVVGFKLEPAFKAEAVISARSSSRRGVGRTFGRGLRLSIRLVGFVGRLILAADGSSHRSQVPGT